MFGIVAKKVDGGQGDAVGGLVDGDHLVFGIIAKKVDGGQGDAVGGLAQASVRDGGAWAGECPHIPWVTTTLATLPCSNSALEFIKYPGVDGELLIHTPS